MKYTKFFIKNYKGIDELEINLDILPDYKIYTLVGLNESGKTTILEAINDFDVEVPEAEKHKLIPKKSAGGFTGEVFISATIQITQADKTQIEKYLETQHKIKLTEIEDELTLTKKYVFDNSKFQSPSKKEYTNFIKIKKNKSSKFAELDTAISAKLWSFIKKSLFPEIIFYRDFLSKFPEKIYLEPTSDDIKGLEYKSIIEDVLVSLKPSYNIEKSLLERLQEPDRANNQSLKVVEGEISAKITEKVFDAWSKLQNVSRKEIIANTGFDLVDEVKRFYIELNVKEGSLPFSISERSLGFRWFFTFLLYTEFRKERIQNSGEILFLLDEPASNLHQSAQKSLLDTFKQITEKSRLIYTTHSHHLINPEWLSNTYVIKNEGLKYETDENGFNYNSINTKIEAYKYKQFVSKHPNQTDYFRPILDVLDYQPGLLEMIPNIVITEGKFDYFTFKYFKELVFKNTKEYKFYPGHSATKLDLPISLYESWGKQYLVLLDSDKEGKKQQDRYIKDVSDKDHIFTLQDVNKDFIAFTTESLFSDTEKINISKEFNSNLTSFEKSSFNTGLQILFSQKKVPDYISVGTKSKMQEIFNFIESKMENLQN